MPASALNDRPAYSLRTLQVRQLDKSKYGFIRIVLGGPELDGFDYSGAACWVKVFVPHMDPSTGRAYTVRDYSERRGEVTIEVVRRRRGGTLSNWIANEMKIGDWLQLAGPRGGAELDHQADWHLLLGDETALPAIGSMLDGVDQSKFKAIVEVPYPEYAYLRQPGLRYLFRGMYDATSDSYLLPTLDHLPDLPGKGDIWIAGEAGLVKQLKQHCVKRWGNGLHRIKAAGYWKMGLNDYRDEEAFG